MICYSGIFFGIRFNIAFPKRFNNCVLFLHDEKDRHGFMMHWNLAWYCKVSSRVSFCRMARRSIL
jgi:hypothetical protein